MGEVAKQIAEQVKAEGEIPSDTTSIAFVISQTGDVAAAASSPVSIWTYGCNSCDVPRNLLILPEMLVLFGDGETYTML